MIMQMMCRQLLFVLLLCAADYLAIVLCFRRFCVAVGGGRAKAGWVLWWWTDENSHTEKYRFTRRTVKYWNSM